jgi:hypothetical protein
MGLKFNRIGASSRHGVDVSVRRPEAAIMGLGNLGYNIATAAGPGGPVKRIS